MGSARRGLREGGVCWGVELLDVREVVREGGKSDGAVFVAIGEVRFGRVLEDGREATGGCHGLGPDRGIWRPVRASIAVVGCRDGWNGVLHVVHGLPLHPACHSSAMGRTRRRILRGLTLVRQGARRDCREVAHVLADDLHGRRVARGGIRDIVALVRVVPGQYHLAGLARNIRLPATGHLVDQSSIALVGAQLGTMARAGALWILW